MFPHCDQISRAARVVVGSLVLRCFQRDLWKRSSILGTVLLMIRFISRYSDSAIIDTLQDDHIMIHQGIFLNEEYKMSIKRVKCRISLFILCDLVSHSQSLPQAEMRH